MVSMIDQMETCVLCNSAISGFGNNPEPLANKGRCCDGCNQLVIVARLKQAYGWSGDNR